MVSGDILAENHVLGIPCMVNHCSAKKTDKPYTESKSGILLLENSIQSSRCYILSVHTPSREWMKNVDHVLLGDDDKNVDAFFNLGQRNIIVKGCPVIAWRCKPLCRHLQEVFQPKHQWSLIYDSKEKENEGESTCTKALSWFVLYQVDEEEMMRFGPLDLSSYASLICPNLELRTGMDVITRSYPFGPDEMEIFTDARSGGIVCNTSTSDHGGFFMVDARCLPGSEGGGVCTPVSGKGYDHLIGMIVTPLCWKTNELIGFTVCCSIKEIFESLRSVIDNLEHPHIQAEMKRLLQFYISDARHHQFCSTHSPGATVVRVVSGGIWGSGVVVAAKMKKKMYEIIIVTCRHVLEKAIERDVETATVTFDGLRKRYAASIVFATDENSVYDLAILKLTMCKEIFKVLSIGNNLKEGEQFVIKHYEHVSKFTKGTPVYMNGYSLFDTQSNLGATISRGVLSNTIAHQGTPVLLHSTCLVHKGSSGGGLFCAESGTLEGIIVNHVKDDDSGISYPDVNFSIPCNIFMPAVKSYLKRDDPSVFSSLNSFDKDLIRIWNLEPQSSRIQSKL